MEVREGKQKGRGREGGMSMGGVRGGVEVGEW